MKQNDDPLYKFIEHFDEKNILNTEEKRKYMYKKISYNSYNVEYQQWKSRVLDRAFSKYNVHKSLRANAIWIIYKELEDNFDITLEDEYAFEARSKLEYVYMHEELRNFFMEKIIEHLEEFYSSDDLKKYKIYFAVNNFLDNKLREPLIKIGCTSRCPYQRIKESTQTFNKGSWKLLGYKENAFKTDEKYIHDEFSLSRRPDIGREIFTFSLSLSSFILDYCTETDDDLFDILWNFTLKHHRNLLIQE